MNYTSSILTDDVLSLVHIQTIFNGRKVRVQALEPQKPIFNIVSYEKKTLKAS